MLIYHPAYDAYHGVFRMLVVVEQKRDIEIDKARLLDFYLLFPSQVAKMRLAPGSSKVKRAANGAANVYHDPVSALAMFREMRHIQLAALKCVAASGFVSLERLAAGFVTRTDTPLPDALRVKVAEFLTNRESLAEYILGTLGDMALRGANGLKDRSELMEYRYDVV
jgi:hypothetical protein